MSNLRDGIVVVVVVVVVLVATALKIKDSVKEGQAAVNAPLTKVLQGVK